jgi:hypothetical protein
MSVDVLRMVERIIVAAGGIASIYWGYKLFSSSSLSNNSGGTFKSRFFTVTMTKVGPGVFFALFGAYILISDLNSQIDYKEVTAPATAAPLAVGRESDFHGVVGGDQNRVVPPCLKLFFHGC